MGSRDAAFVQVVGEIRQQLLQVAGVAAAAADTAADEGATGGRSQGLGGTASSSSNNSVEYTTVLMQGSGTFGNEAVIGSAIPWQVRV